MVIMEKKGSADKQPVKTIQYCEERERERGNKEDIFFFNLKKKKEMK